MSAPQHDIALAAPALGAPRYGQLLYTSFDDGSGVGGGWQVKSESGALSGEERQQLTARVATGFDVGPGLPQFPTPDQIAARPARSVQSNQHRPGRSAHDP